MTEGIMHLPTLTQEIVDQEFSVIKADWDERVRESGADEKWFIHYGGGANLLYCYNEIKKHVKAQGFHMPELVKGLTIKSGDELL